MLACGNYECSRRYCEQCLLIHLNENATEQPSEGWSIVAGKVSESLFVKRVEIVCEDCGPSRVLLVCSIDLLAVALVLSDLPEQVLLRQVRMLLQSSPLQGFPLPPLPRTEGTEAPVLSGRPLAQRKGCRREIQDALCCQRRKVGDGVEH